FVCLIRGTLTATAKEIMFFINVWLNQAASVATVCTQFKLNATLNPTFMGSYIPPIVVPNMIAQAPLD
ncbi:hypothetical protein, partial [Staphylococcus aureus]